LVLPQAAYPSPVLRSRSRVPSWRRALEARACSFEGAWTARRRAAHSASALEAFGNGAL